MLCNPLKLNNSVTKMLLITLLKCVTHSVSNTKTHLMQEMLNSNYLTSLKTSSENKKKSSETTELMKLTLSKNTQNLSLKLDHMPELTSYNSHLRSQEN